MIDFRVLKFIMDKNKNHYGGILTHSAANLRKNSGILHLFEEKNRPADSIGKCKNTISGDENHKQG